jgi:hypothetical protein
LAEENDVIILLTNQLNEITLVHSPTNLGRTHSCPENKIVALQGLSNDAGAILIDLILATKATQVTVRKGEDILKYTMVQTRSSPLRDQNHFEDRRKQLL